MADYSSGSWRSLSHRMRYFYLSSGASGPPPAIVMEIFEEIPSQKTWERFRNEVNAERKRRAQRAYRHDRQDEVIRKREQRRIYMRTYRANKRLQENA